MKPEIELSDSLTSVNLYDIKYAAEYCDVDEAWLTMNIVSILSNKLKISENKRAYKSLVGHPLHFSQSYPAMNWNGRWNDILDIVASFTGKRSLDIAYIMYKYTKNENDELSIRIRHFSGSHKKSVYGQSQQLKQDLYGNYYVWMYDSNSKLHQVPQQYLKEYLLEFDANHFD